MSHASRPDFARALPGLHLRFWIDYVLDNKVPLRDVGGMESGGCLKLKRETHVKPLHIIF